MTNSINFLVVLLFIFVRVLFPLSTDIIILTISFKLCRYILPPIISYCTIRQEHSINPIPKLTYIPGHSRVRTRHWTMERQRLRSRPLLKWILLRLAFFVFPFPPSLIIPLQCHCPQPPRHRHSSRPRCGHSRDPP